MKQRRSEDEPKKEGAKTPFLCLCGKHYFGAFNKGGTKEKSRTEAAENAPESKKERSKYCGIFFCQASCTFVHTKSVAPGRG